MNSRKSIDPTQQPPAGVDNVSDSGISQSGASMAETLDLLNELIAALDRRQPRMHPAEEAAVASAAANLRNEAVKRIREIKGKLERRQ
jgi:hypothetical protein